MQQPSDSQATSPNLVSTGYHTPEKQASVVKGIARRAAYQALVRLNKTQQKVTEEELRVFATEAAVTTQIANYPVSHGEPAEAMKLFIEAYMVYGKDYFLGQPFGTVKPEIVLIC